jgi:zinc transporter ZupT
MEKPSTARIALKWGLISAIAVIIFSTVIWITEFWRNGWASNLTFLLLIPVLVMAYKEFKEANNGFMSFGEGLGLGVLLSGVSAIISGIFSYIYMNFIDNTFMSKMIDFQREQMTEKGLTDEQIDQSMQMIQKFTSPGLAFIFGIIGWLVVGFIFSLIVTAIMRKSKPEMDF